MTKITAAKTIFCTGVSPSQPQNTNIVDNLKKNNYLYYLFTCKLNILNYNLFEYIVLVSPISTVNIIIYLFENSYTKTFSYFLVEQAIRLLVKTKIDLKAKNLENSTALDIAGSAEIKNVLVRAGAKHGSSVTDSPTIAEKQRWNVTLAEKIMIFVIRMRRDITEDQRQAFLIVAALIATATYQSALSPPGGVYQANSENNINNNVSITSVNSTTTANAGSSVMSEGDFMTLSILNSFSLLVSTVAICILTPSGIVGSILLTPLIWFAYCYLYSMKVISPTNASSIVNLVMVCLFPSLHSGVRWAFSSVYKRLKRRQENTEIETRNATTGRNIW